MTKFADKAREVKAAGVAKRGDWTPPEAATRVYNYWLDNTDSKKGRAIRRGDRRENLCHFGRVVLFWAPLLALWNLAGRVAENPLTWILAGIAAVAGTAAVIMMFGTLYWLQTAGVVAVGVLGLLAFVFAVLGGISLAQDSDELRAEYDLPSLRVAKWSLLLFPISLTSWGLATLARRIGGGPVAVGSLVVVTLAFLTVVTIDIGIIEMLKGLGIVLATIVAIALFFAGIFLASDYIAGRRALRKERAEAEFLALSIEEQQERLANFENPEPSRVEKFLTTVADFVVFIAQVVRVKKWKVCPFVSIDAR